MKDLSEKYDVLGAIESAMFLMPEIKDRIHKLKIPGIIGHFTELDNPYMNLVGYDPHSVYFSEKTVKEVVSFFSQKQLPFSWLVGPSSPDEIIDYLKTEGIEKYDDIDGMSFTRMDNLPQGNPAVRVVEVNKTESAIFSRLQAKAFEMPLDMAEYLAEVLYFYEAGQRIRNFFAYVEQSNEPVGLGCMVYLPDNQIVQLIGSAVLPDYRGRGVYTSILAHRLKIARDDNISAAIIQANPESSAPVCRKHGFEIVCRQKMFLKEFS